MPVEREELSQNQPRGNATDTSARDRRSSPIDQWAKAEFLVRMAKAQIAVAEAAGKTAHPDGAFFRKLAFLVECL